VTISIDFETRSIIDLKKTGVYPYAQHPTTDVWCMAYAKDDGEVNVWTPGQPIPEVILNGASTQQFRAHNAQFERIIWREIMVKRYGFPPITMQQWHCTAAECRAMGLPGGLDGAAKALGLEHQKDAVGQRLMLRMSKPRTVQPDGTLTWWNTADRVAKLIAYCKQDVVVERAIAAKVQRLTDAERAVYLLDQKINDRGVQIDTRLIEAAIDVVDAANEKANADLSELTNGAVTSITKNADLSNWLGVDSVAKAHVRDLLEKDLPPNVRRVLELRQEVSKSSVAKLVAFMECRCSDSRVRGLLMYHGAATGRWSGRLVQPQNFPRGDFKHTVIEDAIPLVLNKDLEGIDTLYGSVHSLISSMLRACFIAKPGHTLFSADYAAIEARVLAWLAGEKDALDVFRSGQDIYCHAATGIYNRTITAADKDERQIGKVAVLALGYQGGVKAFQSMATMYNIQIPDEKADEIKNAWRKANARIVSWWAALENAALDAVHSGVGVAPGVVFGVEDNWMWCQLPSGRKLWYSNPRLVERETPWGALRTSVKCDGVNSVTKKFEPFDLYGGLLAENIVQAVSRDLMASAMLRLEDAGYPIIMTVHDEVIAESSVENGTLAEFTDILCKLPSWAKGLPLTAEGWTGQRYRK
jgi:DNA polymerase